MACPLRTQPDQHLRRFDESEHGAIVHGAMVAANLDDKPFDAAVSMLSERPEHGRARDMAQQTIQALREVGILDEIVPKQTASARSITADTGASVPPTAHPFRLSPVTSLKPLRKPPKRVSELAQTRWQNVPFTIQHTSSVDKKGRTVERLGAFDGTGNLLGLITPEGEVQVAEGSRISLKFALTANGNVRAVWQHSE